MKNGDEVPVEGRGWSDALMENALNFFHFLSLPKAHFFSFSTILNFESKNDQIFDTLKDTTPPPPLGGTFHHFDWEIRNAIETKTTVIKMRNALDKTWAESG